MMYHTALVRTGLALLATCVAVPAAVAAGDRYYPDVDTWQKSPNFAKHAAAFADPSHPEADPACQDFFQYSFLQENKEVLRTDSLLVIKGGMLEFEQYAPPQLPPDKAAKVYYGPFTADRPHILFSVSKTVSSAIIAAAVQNGKLTEDTRLAQYFPRQKYRTAIRPGPDDYEQGRFDAAAANEANYDLITLRDLVEMGSGMQWSETYGDDPLVSSVLRLLYVKGFVDAEAYAAMQPMVKEIPGTIWNYSSGNISLAMGILRKAYGDEAFASLPWTLLFNPLGFRNAVFERDLPGSFVGSSYVHLRPLDMAKLGYLYLNDGMWKGQRIISSAWVKASQNMVPAYTAPATLVANATDDGVYGRTWWLNQDSGKISTATGKPVGLPYPDLPTDLYAALGHYGQSIWVIPSKDMVVVRTAQDRDPHVFDVNRWLSTALKCFP